jgi:hypothetical protein
MNETNHGTTLRLIKFGRTWKHIVSFLIVITRIGLGLTLTMCIVQFACKKRFSLHNTVTKRKGGLPFLRHEAERGFTLLLVE